VQLGDSGAQLVEVGDLPVELSKPGGEQLLYVVAGSVAGVSEVEDVGDLGEREPGVRPRRMKSRRSPASGG
jgi:hypothetical protein